MLGALGKFRGRSFDEIKTRGGQALRARAERIWWRVGGMRSLPEALKSAEISTEFPFSPNGKHGVGPRAIAGAIGRESAQEAEALRKYAEEVKKGVVALMGYGAIDAGSPPRWNQDPVTGRAIPRGHWSRIDYLDRSVLEDYKLLWELNRHQYLLPGAMCWLMRGERSDFELVQSHLQSWLDENPREASVNWVSSLELAYRAITWCWLLWMMGDAPWRANLKRSLVLSIQAHALHIERYLSTYFSPNTHLTGEALGLFYIGTALRGSPMAKRWRKKGAEILELWIERQIYADGAYFEQSTQYQRYTTEIYLHYLLLARASGWHCSDRIADRLSRSFDVLRSIATGSGRMPLIGDDDGGLLLPFDLRPPDDIRALLLAGAVALDRVDLATPNAPVGMAYWLCGVEKTVRMLDKVSTSPPWRDIHFPVGGIAVLRDGWESTDSIAVIDAGPHGVMNCGHGHADALTMTLSVGQTDIFVDRGTFTYSGPERNEFRSTGSHNTLEFDEESSVEPDRPFHWKNIPPRADGRVFSTNEFCGFVGQATGHAATGRTSLHIRSVLHERHGSWAILDRGNRAGTGVRIVRWQLAPTARVVQESSRKLLVMSPTDNLLATVLIPFSARVWVSTRSVSLRFGHKADAQLIGIEAARGRHEILTIITPGTLGELDLPVEEGLPRGDGLFSWRDRTGSHLLVASTVNATTCSYEGITVEADLAWWTCVTNERTEGVPQALSAERFAAVGVRQLVTTDAKISARGEFAVLRKLGSRWDEGVAQEPVR